MKRSPYQQDLLSWPPARGPALVWPSELPAFERHVPSALSEQEADRHLTKWTGGWDLLDPTVKIQCSWYEDVNALVEQVCLFVCLFSWRDCERMNRIFCSLRWNDGHGRILPGWGVGYWEQHVGATTPAGDPCQAAPLLSVEDHMGSTLEESQRLNMVR